MLIGLSSILVGPRLICFIQLIRYLKFVKKSFTGATVLRVSKIIKNISSANAQRCIKMLIVQIKTLTIKKMLPKRDHKVLLNSKILKPTINIIDCFLLKMKIFLFKFIIFTGNDKLRLHSLSIRSTL